MTAYDGGITTKHLITDTRVGKKKIAPLPHLIADTVDDLARGRIEAIETKGEPSVLKPGQSKKLIRNTKIKAAQYEELTHEEKQARQLHKGVGHRMRS